MQFIDFLLIGSSLLSQITSKNYYVSSTKSSRLLFRGFTTFGLGEGS